MFSCSRRRCSCLVRFACAWLNRPLGLKCLSKSGTMIGIWKMAVSFKLCVTMLVQCAQRSPSDRWHWWSNDLRFSLLEELGYEEPATEAGRALAWPFFFRFEKNFCRSKRSKKKGKEATSSSDPWIEERRKTQVLERRSGVHRLSTRVHEKDRSNAGPRQPPDRPAAGPLDTAAVKWPSKPKAGIAMCHGIWKKQLRRKMRTVSKSATFSQRKMWTQRHSRGEKEVHFWPGKVQNSSPFLRCTYLVRLSVKPITNFSASKVTSLSLQSMHTGPGQGQIGPLLRRGFFFVGNGSGGFFVLPDASSFWSHFSAADCKTTKFSFKTLCRCDELPAKRLDSSRESARYWLHPVLSTQGEQLVPADDRKEGTTLPHSFSP